VTPAVLRRKRLNGPRTGRSRCLELDNPVSHKIGAVKNVTISLVVATALESGSHLLLTEDLQHVVIDDLRVANPVMH